MKRVHMVLDEDHIEYLKKVSHALTGKESITNGARILIERDIMRTYRQLKHLDNQASEDEQ